MLFAVSAETNDPYGRSSEVYLSPTGQPVVDHGESVYVIRYLISRLPGLWLIPHPRKPARPFFPFYVYCAIVFFPRRARFRRASGSPARSETSARRPRAAPRSRFYTSSVTYSHARLEIYEAFYCRVIMFHACARALRSSSAITPPAKIYGISCVCTRDTILRLLTPLSVIRPHRTCNVEQRNEVPNYNIRSFI